MQTKFVEMANDAVAVNAKLINKSVDYNVKAARDAVKNASVQAGELLKVKTFEDYTALQGKLVQSAIDQASSLSRTYIELGFEARDAYTALWQDYAAAPVQKKSNAPVAKVA